VEGQELLSGLTNTGLAGMLFYMWYMQNRKETALQEIIKEQVEDKKLMREERVEFIRIIREQATMLGRFDEALTNQDR